MKDKIDELLFTIANRKHGTFRCDTRTKAREELIRLARLGAAFEKVAQAHAEAKQMEPADAIELMFKHARLGAAQDKTV